MGLFNTSKNKTNPNFKSEVISKNEFEKQVDNSVVTLIDVRTPEEFNSGKIYHAKNINFFANDFETQINKLDKSKPVYLYCRSGNRSQKAANKMKYLGFNHVIDLEGGYMAWESNKK